MQVVNCRNLEAEMKRYKITRADIASLLELSYSTIHTRFNCNSQWLYEECVKIQENFFPDNDLKYLFEISEIQR